VLFARSYPNIYDIAYSEEAIADLGWFKKHEQSEILDRIDQQLRYEPTLETRNRKHLRPNATAEWELRIGDFRVLYNVDEQVLIVDIQRIGEKRGNAFFFQGRKDDL
jgi:mRNA-degrading endonuclease RelE of RelBE toxin-antitoxin system